MDLRTRQLSRLRFGSNRGFLIGWRRSHHVVSRTSIWLCVSAGGAAPASSRYGERPLTDPDDRLCNPLLGEPAANTGEELGDLRRRRRALVVEIPATVAPSADSAAVAPQALGEQNRAQLVRCADPHPTP